MAVWLTATRGEPAPPTVHRVRRPPAKPSAGSSGQSCHAALGLRRVVSFSGEGEAPTASLMQQVHPCLLPLLSARCAYTRSSSLSRCSERPFQACIVAHCVTEMLCMVLAHSRAAKHAGCIHQGRRWRASVIDRRWSDPFFEPAHSARSRRSTAAGRIGRSLALPVNPGRSPTPSTHAHPSLQSSRQLQRPPQHSPVRVGSGDDGPVQPPPRLDLLPALASAWGCAPRVGDIRRHRRLEPVPPRHLKL